MKKIGILGGTFDPIHYGHLFIAENVLQQLQLDKIMFIPTGIPPHKNENLITSKEHRYKMTKLAISDNKHFGISDIELKKDGICYTIDTINQLYEIYKNTEFYYIVGADSLNCMTSWKSPEEIFKKIKIIAIDRFADNINIKSIASDIIQKFNADITIVNIPLIEFSSTDIRNRIKNNLSVKYMLPEIAAEYIKKNNLYTEDNHGNTVY